MLKESLPNGLWGTVNIHDTTFEITLKKDEIFQYVLLRNTNGIRFEEKIVNNNSILEMWLYGKYLGICSFTNYYNVTNYIIFDLEKYVTTNYDSRQYARHIAQVKHESSFGKDCLDGTKINLEKGTITLKNGKEMNFDEYFEFKKQT